MNKLILKRIALIADRKLTRCDIRIIRTRLARLSTEKTDKLMSFINDRSRISLRELSELLLYSISYRLRMPIKEMYTYNSLQNSEEGCYLCPQCGAAIEFDFQDFCSSCGQALGWDNYENVIVRKAGEQSCAEEEKFIDEVELDIETMLI